MAFSYLTYTGNGSTTQYAINFPYIDTTHIKAYLGGTVTTAFSVSGSTLTFNTAPANSVVIRIERETPIDARLVDFQDGSVLTQAELDMSADQNFYIAQETNDDQVNNLRLTTADVFDAQSKRIINVANPTNNNDAVNKTYLENTWLSTANKTALTLVASNITSINTVNSNATNINTVNSNSTNINLVAGSIGSVNTVATDIAKVIAVANDLAEAVSEVETVADDLNESTSEIHTVGTNIANVNIVGLAIANVNSLAGKNTQLGLLGTSAVITNLGSLGTSANVTAMGLLGTSGNITAMGLLGTSAVITDLGLLGTSAIVEDLGILGTSDNVTKMGVLGTSANVTAMGLLGTSANVTNMGTLGTSANVSNMSTLAGISGLSNLASAHASVTSVANSLASVNNFANIYRISSSAPTSSLDTGDLWWDSTNNILKVYGASGFQSAGSSINGTSARFKYIATNNQTTFSGSDASSNTLAYDPLYLDVYLNGVHLDPTDFTASTGSSIVLATGASTGDILYIVGFGTFNIANIAGSAVTSGTINSARLPTVPTSKGGTGLTAIGTAGQALKVNASANGLEYGSTSSAEVYGFEKFFSASTLVKTVTVVSVSGANKYFIDGVQQDTLDLYEGNTYIFNYPSAHPFKFSTTSNGSHASGSEYTTGVTHNSSTQLTIVIAASAPTLYYYCSSHSGMGGTANTPAALPSTLTYSTNPAEILLDLLGDGLDIADTDIDMASFYLSKLDCVSAGFTCHIALIQQANIQSIIADVLSTCRGKIFHSESKWKFKIDTKSQSVADALTSDDVMSNSLSISMSGSGNLANKMILKYINPADQYLSAQVVKQDSDLQSYDGLVIQKTLDIKGINNATHANKLCEIALNSLRYSEDASGNRLKQTPLSISFATSVKNAHLEVGDVISLNHALLDRVRQFLILSTATDQSGVIQITAREYAETHFKNASGNYLI